MISCNIAIGSPFSRKVSWRRLGRIIREVLAAEAVDYPAAVSLAITDDATVRELNRRWRGIDRTTDVLSFPFQEKNTESFPNPDGTVQLGEVIIALPQAERQAERMGHPLDREITVLLIHGLLHLLGYDHRKPSERRRMRARQEAILIRLTEGGIHDERGDR